MFNNQALYQSQTDCHFSMINIISMDSISMDISTDTNSTVIHRDSDSRHSNMRSSSVLKTCISFMNKLYCTFTATRQLAFFKLAKLLFRLLQWLTTFCSQLNHQCRSPLTHSLRTALLLKEPRHSQNKLGE